MTNVSKKAIKAARESMTAISAQYLELAKNYELKLESATDSVEIKALEDELKKSTTHHKAIEVLLNMSDDCFAVLLEQNVNVEALAHSSRELKKRTERMIVAVARQARIIKDNALDAIITRLAAKRDNALTLAQIQREMNHTTKTQANYFKTLCEFFDIAHYDKRSEKLVFNYDSFFLNAMIDAYLTDEQREQLAAAKEVEQLQQLELEQISA